MQSEAPLQSSLVERWKTRHGSNKRNDVLAKASLQLGILARSYQDAHYYQNKANKINVKCRIAWLSKNRAICQQPGWKSLWQRFPRRSIGLVTSHLQPIEHAYGWTYCVFIFNVSCSFHLQLMQSTPNNWGWRVWWGLCGCEKYTNITPGL